MLHKFSKKKKKWNSLFFQMQLQKWTSWLHWQSLPLSPPPSSLDPEVLTWVTHCPKLDTFFLLITMHNNGLVYPSHIPNMHMSFLPPFTHISSFPWTDVQEKKISLLSIYLPCTLTALSSVSHLIPCTYFSHLPCLEKGLVHTVNMYKSIPGQALPPFPSCIHWKLFGACTVCSWTRDIHHPLEQDGWWPELASSPLDPNLGEWSLFGKDCGAFSTFNFDMWFIVSLWLLKWLNIRLLY
jgi:hypothetical protein